MSRNNLHYLLLQVRDENDPIREQEVRCFARALDCDRDRIEVFSLLDGHRAHGVHIPTTTQIDRADCVLFGGSGDYSVAAGGPAMERALEVIRTLVQIAKPTFASCWGFQAMAAAMGGEVVTDMNRAELGTLAVQLTEAGRADAIFGSLPDPFVAPMGHQDIVDSLPAGTKLLASTDRVTHQAFRFEDKPIYCTQFHPELDLPSLIERLRVYPSYVAKIAGVPLEAFIENLVETPEAGNLLRQFVRIIF